MLRSLSRAGLRSSLSVSCLCPSASGVRLGVSSRPSLGSSSAVQRRFNASAPETTGPALSGEDGSVAQVSALDDQQDRSPARRNPSQYPGMIRLPPYMERFDWSSERDRASLIDAQIKHDADEAPDPRTTQRELSRLARRMGPPTGLLNVQQSLLREITQVINESLPSRNLVVMGPASWEATVASTNPKLALVARRGSDDLPPTTAERTAELQTIVPALKAAGMSVNVREGILRAHYPPTAFHASRRGPKFKPSQITISHQLPEKVIGNAIIASYMALSPDVLVPLFRAVTAIPNRIKVSDRGEVDNARAVMAICYLQSLPQELLPRLSHTPLVRDFGVKRTTIELNKTLAGKQGTARVDYTFVPIGAASTTLVRAGFTAEDKEIKFVRSWRNKVTPALSELVSGFYYWYAGEVEARFDWARDVVSVKGRLTRAVADPEGKFANDTMVILDPLNPYINLAAGFKHTKEAINAGFIEGLRDELVADTNVKIEDILPRKGFVAPPRQQYSAQKSRPKKAASPDVPAGVASLEAAVPQESAPEGMKEDVKHEVAADAEGVVEQVKTMVDEAKVKAEEIKQAVQDKVESAQEVVSDKVDGAEKAVADKVDEARKP